MANSAYGALALALTVGTAGLSSQQLVLDINRTTSGTASSSPADPVATSSGTWFTATTSLLGRELWRIDPAGAVSLVGDLIRGSASSNPGSIAEYGSGVVFTADRGAGRLLWRLPGIGLPLQQLTPGSPPILGTAAVVVAGANIFFLGDDSGHGQELWVSRGLAGDARLVRDIRPGADSPLINMMVAIGSRVVFLADDGQHGYEWWTSDGTEPGTTLLADANPGPAHGALAIRPLALGGQLYLTVDDGLSGAELWRTTGAPGVLQQVADIAAGPASSYPSRFAALPSGRLVFAAFDPAHGAELWESDGTSAGTRLLADLWPGNIGSDPRDLVAASTGVFFVANDPSLGRELCFTDGTATRVLDLTTGSAGTAVTSLTASGARAYFYAPNPAQPALGQLLVSDGTAAGTVTLLQLDGSIRPQIVPRPAGGAAFVGNAGNTGAEPWLTDGSPAGTHLARDIETLRPTGDALPSLVGAIAGRVLFTANDGATVGLWASDGRAARTGQLLAATGTGARYARLSQRVLLTAYSSGQTQLIGTDGTAAGTQVLGPALPVAAWPGSNPVLDPDHALFAAPDGTLRITDGTLPGTRPVANVSASDFTSDGAGVVYFVGYDARSGRELWRTDGTAAGTRIVADIQPPAESAPPDILGTVQGRVVFTANDGTGRAVWVSDGTAAGTRLLVRTTVVPYNAQAAEVAGRLVFTVGPGTFATDGTPSGTVQLPVGSNQSRLAGVGAMVFVYEADALAGRLWRTDGTAAGTSLVPSALPPGVLNLFAVSESQVVFAIAEGSNTGRGTIVASDGTAAGTRALARLTVEGSLPVLWPQAADGRLFYADREPATGHELYVVDLGAAAQAEGYGCGAAPFGLRLTATEPHLGQTMLVAAPNSLPASALVFGIPAARPLVLPGTSCALWFDVTQPSVALGMPGGAAAIPLPVVNALVGARAMLQAFAGPSAGPIGLEFSNGLRLVLDY